MLDVRLAAASDAFPAAETRRVDTRGRSSQLRLAAGLLSRELDKPAALDVSGLTGERLSAFVEGLVLGGHRLAGPTAAPADLPVRLVGVQDESALERGRSAAAATMWARELANTPASTKTPSWLGTRAAGQLRPLGVEVAVRDEQWLADEGFGGVLAVGAGAAAPPRLIEASWRPRRARAGVHAVLVGKGITFDTGGINLKR
ncbi:MAG: leucyl aminopeptidase, partial [Pseudonocardiales bacterium]|nr:leucyl aminopeptidase [Pseudonocardiales bacterium]